MSDDAPNQHGKVGYRRPPTHSRFQKGQSGNPRGRQKGVRNFATDVKRSLEMPVTLNEKGKSKRVSTQEALILRMREKALKGDPRALECLLALAGMHNTGENGQSFGGQNITAEDQTILDAYAVDVKTRPPVVMGRASGGAEASETLATEGDRRDG